MLFRSGRTFISSVDVIISSDSNHKLKSFILDSQKNTKFTKPNDVQALKLMNHAAKELMEEHPDIVLAFGESDEFRLVLPMNLKSTIYRFVDYPASFTLEHSY